MSSNGRLIKGTLALLACLLLGMQTAAAQLVWQPAPMQKTKPAKPTAVKPGGGDKVGEGKAKHAGHGRRGPKQFVLDGIGHDDSATVNLWQPDLAVQSLELAHGRVGVRATGMDSYHALVAQRKTSSGGVESAVRYLYLRGKPGDSSPRMLTTAVKTPFEIVPAPLPREHRRYHANHDAVFVLRYEGELLPNTPVTLSTANGSEQQLVTDRIGALRFTLPDDFAETTSSENKAGRDNNHPAEFILRSSISRDGRDYRTSLSAPYHVDPAHWQSFELGVMVLGAGFVTGLAVNRRTARKQQAQQGRAA